MNAAPWTPTRFARLRACLRCVFAICMAANVLMLCILSIGFTYQFTTFTWRFLLRTLFSSEW